MNRTTRYVSISVCGGSLALALLGFGPHAVAPTTSAQGKSAVQAPLFEVDPYWPKPLPNHWVTGPISGAWADDQDHIWIAHRGGGSAPDGTRGLDMKPPYSEICCAAAPPIMEFDQAGNLLRHWGGQSSEYQWTGTHGLSIDYKGNVWLGGQADPDSQVLKFNKDGKFLMQVGKSAARLRAGTGGPAPAGGGPNPNPPIYDTNNEDMENFGRPTKVVVNQKTNEAFVSDGYVNQRVVVMDADTGKFKRVWGAYGDKPELEMYPGPRNSQRAMLLPTDRYGAHDPSAPPQKQFRNPVHCLTLSKDDIVYVCDRQGDRFQSFTTQGKFLKEKVILPKTMNQGSAWDIALSSDPQQTFLYLADGENHLIHILKRDTLEELTAFGEGGRQPGQMFGPHVMTSDSKGNLYVGEWGGERFQKFTNKGLAPVTKPYQGTPWPRASN